MNKVAIAKLLRSAWKKTWSELPKDIQRGYRRQSLRRSGDSLTGALIEGPATRLLRGKTPKGKPNIRGAKKVKNFLWNKIQKPALMGDIAGGKALNVIARNLTPAEKLFKIKEKVQVGKGMFKEYERHSALAPATKAVALASPFIVGLKGQEWLEKLHGQRGNKKIVQAGRSEAALPRR